MIRTFENVFLTNRKMTTIMNLEKKINRKTLKLSY